jgi:hypothetical protein
MARFLSQVYVVVRGSVGGITYLANQYHQLVARARTSPVQPNTPLQSAIKSAFSGAEATWLTLTAAEMSAWDVYAQGTSYKGPLNDYTVPGRLIFIAIQGFRNYMNGSYAAALPASNVAPGTLGWLNLTNVHSVPPAGPGTGVAVSIGTPPGLVGTRIFSEISPGFSPSRNRYKGPWVPGSSKISANIPGGTSGLVEYIGLVAGQVYFVRIRGIFSAGPYRISASFIVRCVAVTVP